MGMVKAEGNQGLLPRQGHAALQRLPRFLADGDALNDYKYRQSQE